MTTGGGKRVFSLPPSEDGGGRSGGGDDHIGALFTTKEGEGEGGEEAYRTSKRKGEVEAAASFSHTHVHTHTHMYIYAHQGGKKGVGVGDGVSGMGEMRGGRGGGQALQTDGRVRYASLHLIVSVLMQDSSDRLKKLRLPVRPLSPPFFPFYTFFLVLPHRKPAPRMVIGTAHASQGKRKDLSADQTGSLTQ